MNEIDSCRCEKLAKSTGEAEAPHTQFLTFPALN